MRSLKLIFASLLFLSGCCTCPLPSSVSPPTVTPIPVPTATPIATPSPTPPPVIGVQIQSARFEKPGPENGYAPAVSSTETLLLAQNETDSIVLQVTGPSGSCIPVPTVAGLAIQAQIALTLITTTPSNTTTTAGIQYDPLAPAAELCAGNWYNLDVQALPTASGASGVASAQFGGLSLTVQIADWMIPQQPTMPLYMELDSFSLLAGHGYPNTTGVAIQGPLTAQYVALLRAHRIEPYGQRFQDPAITSGSLNIDQWNAYNASFRQLSVTGAMGETCMVDHEASLQTAAYYQATQATLASQGFKGWNYMLDEPATSALPSVLSLASLSKANAPLLETMVTHEPWAAAIGAGIDHFTVLFEQFKAAGHWSDYSQAPGYWIYGSCESGGSCSNGTVGKRTGSPDLMLDEPTVNARAFPVVAFAMGAKAALYYSANNDYGLTDVWQNQYEFGGNGDGQLVYPCGPNVPSQKCTADMAYSSFRLKAIRRGQNDNEWLVHTGGKAPVASAMSFTQSNAAFDAIRL